MNEIYGSLSLPSLLLAEVVGKYQPLYCSRWCRLPHPLYRLCPTTGEDGEERERERDRERERERGRKRRGHRWNEGSRTAELDKNNNRGGGKK